MKIVLLDVFFIFLFCLGQHSVHSSYQEATSSAARVKHPVGRFDFCQVCKQLGYMFGGKNYAKRLPITATISNKLTIKTAKHIFWRIIAYSIEDVGM